MYPYILFLIFFASMPLVWGQTGPSTQDNWGDQIFKVAEQMPRFPGYVKRSNGKIEYWCDELDSEIEIKRCSNAAMLRWINEHLEYPDEAYDNEIQGTVLIHFIVEKEGYITESKIVRDIGYGCGEAAKELIDKMNDLEEM